MRRAYWETMTTLGELGETEVLDRILSRVRVPGGVQVGPGDDAAISTVPPGARLVSTTDMLVEGEDFLPAWLDPYQLGVKAGAQNLADVAAMGADPHGLLVTVAAPADTDIRVLGELYDGLRNECDRAGTGIIGGDLSASQLLTVSICALGLLPVGRHPLLRSAARPGDTVVLVGTVGRAAAGLDLLFAGHHLGAGEVGQLIATQLAPRPDYQAAAALRDWARAGIDVSDGLVGDLGRVARASGAHIDLQRDALDELAQPLLPAAAALQPEAGTDAHWRQARHWVLTGGEDHGILLAGPPPVTPSAVVWRPIAHCRAGEPGVFLDGQPVEDTAFSHFT